jgi:nicotinamidase-related amidase
MSSAVVVIDVQNCFLPGGSLATGNARNTNALPASSLAKSIGKFIDSKNPTNIFITQDWHTPGHKSFVKNGEELMSLRKNAYNNKNFRTNFTRSWGNDDTRRNQKVWPEHCVQGTEGAKLAPDLETYLQGKQGVEYIYKGDEPEIDSYSAIANALGYPTPHTQDGRLFLDILKSSDLEHVYLTGIARNVCVYWTALDMLNYWILPAYNEGKIIKLHFVYDLTRPVASTFDIEKEKIESDVRNLISNMGMNASVYDQVFVIEDSGMYSAEGGRRRTRRHVHNKNCKASCRNNTRKTRNARKTRHSHNKNCKASCRR